MRILALVALLVFSGSAYADLIMRDQLGNSVIITPNPCKDPKVLKHIPPQMHGNFGSGRAMVDGKPFSLCYMPRPDGAVMVVFDDGEGAFIPIQAFVQASES